MGGGGGGGVEKGKLSSTIIYHHCQKTQTFLNTVKILKIGTPEIITIIVLQ